MSEAPWREWVGGRKPASGREKRPYSADTIVVVQLRCQSRGDAERRAPQRVDWWPRWWHDGGPGDIVAVRKA